MKFQCMLATVVLLFLAVSCSPRIDETPDRDRSRIVVLSEAEKEFIESSPEIRSNELLRVGPVQALRLLELASAHNRSEGSHVPGLVEARPELMTFVRQEFMAGAVDLDRYLLLANFAVSSHIAGTYDLLGDSLLFQRMQALEESLEVRQYSGGAGTWTDVLKPVDRGPGYPD